MTRDSWEATLYSCDRQESSPEWCDRRAKGELVEKRKHYVLDKEEPERAMWRCAGGRGVGEVP